MRRLPLCLLLGAAFACGDVEEDEEKHHEVSRPTCTEIASVCHGNTDPVAEACHQMGHAHESTEEQCQNRRAECLSVCGDTPQH